MKRKEMDRAILETYLLALDKDDDYGAVMTLFQTKPDLLREVLYRWFEYQLKTFIFCRGAGMPFISNEQLIELGRLTPNLFADLVRTTFQPPKTEFKGGDEDCVGEISEEEEIAMQQGWLKKNLPEIIEDIKAESASSESYLNSLAGRTRTDEMIYRFISTANNMSDQEDS